jgi:hypothetical protein
MATCLLSYCSFEFGGVYFLSSVVFHSLSFGMFRSFELLDESHF